MGNNIETSKMENGNEEIALVLSWMSCPMINDKKYFGYFKEYNPPTVFILDIDKISDDWDLRFSIRVYNNLRESNIKKYTLCIDSFNQSGFVEIDRRCISYISKQQSDELISILSLTLDDSNKDCHWYFSKERIRHNYHAKVKAMENIVNKDGIELVNTINNIISDFEKKHNVQFHVLPNWYPFEKRDLLIKGNPCFFTKCLD